MRPRGETSELPWGGPFETEADLQRWLYYSRQYEQQRKQQLRALRWQTFKWALKWAAAIGLLLLFIWGLVFIVRGNSGSSGTGTAAAATTTTASLTSDAAGSNDTVSAVASSASGTSTQEIVADSQQRRSWWRRLAGAAAVPLGSWLHALLVRWPQDALLSRLGRRLLGLACLYGLGLQLLLATGLLWAVLRRALLARSHSAAAAAATAAAQAASAAPASRQQQQQQQQQQAALARSRALAALAALCLQPGLLAWVRALPQAVLRRACQLAEAASAWEVEDVGTWLLSLAAAYDLPAIAALPLLVDLRLGQQDMVNLPAARIGAMNALLLLDSLVASAFPVLARPLSGWRLVNTAVSGVARVLPSFLQSRLTRLLAYAALAVLHTVDLAAASGYFVRANAYMGVSLASYTISEGICGDRYCKDRQHLHTHTECRSRLHESRLWWTFQLRTAVPLLARAVCLAAPLCGTLYGCGGLLCMLSLRTVLSLAALACCWGGWVRQAAELLQELNGRGDELEDEWSDAEEEEDDEVEEQEAVEADDELVDCYSDELWQLRLAARLLAPFARRAAATSAGTAAPVAPRSSAAGGSAARPPPPRAAPPSLLQDLRQELHTALRVHLLPLRATLAAYPRPWLPWGLLRLELDAWRSLWRRTCGWNGLLFCGHVLLLVAVYILVWPIATLWVFGWDTLCIAVMVPCVGLVGGFRAIPGAAKVDWLGPGTEADMPAQLPGFVSAALHALSGAIEAAPAAAIKALKQGIDLAARLASSRRQRQQRQQQQPQAARRQRSVRSRGRLPQGLVPDCPGLAAQGSRLALAPQRCPLQQARHPAQPRAAGGCCAAASRRPVPPLKPTRLQHLRQNAVRKMQRRADALPGVRRQLPLLPRLPKARPLRGVSSSSSRLQQNCRVPPRRLKWRKQRWLAGARRSDRPSSGGAPLASLRLWQG
ncbi:hypothetical protein ABPG75_008610 [Micractinium tetrahymenae]